MMTTRYTDNVDEQVIDWPKRIAREAFALAVGCLLLILALLAIVSILSVPGCDASSGAECGPESDVACSMPDAMCGNGVLLCGLEYDGTVLCCSYGDGFADACRCTLCIDYQTKLDAEVEYERAMSWLDADGVGGD
jgi:hypothetical protein